MTHHQESTQQTTYYAPTTMDGHPSSPLADGYYDSEKDVFFWWQSFDSEEDDYPKTIMTTLH